MRKIICISALYLGLLLTFTGCQQPAAPEEVAEKSITVVTTYGPNDGGHAAFVALCAEFTADTAVKIVDESADSTEEWKKDVISSFDTGEEPDVLFFFTGTDVAKLIEAGKFASLDEIRESYPDLTSNINLSVLNGMRAADGKEYAIPVKGYWERMLINTDIFDSLNLRPPTNYGDLLLMAPKLIEGGYIPVAASLSEVPHYWFEALLFNMTGPSNHQRIPTDPNNIPDSWVAALEQFTELYAAGIFPDEDLAPTHADAFELFQSKQAAMIVDGDWSVPYVRDTEHTAVIDFPAIPGEPRKNTDLISGFSMGFYITKKAWEDPEKRDAAASFVEFITSNEAIMRLNSSGAAMPISISPNEQQENSAATPLRRSIDELNEKTTAFVGAVADNFRTEARIWLFQQILPLAKGELDAKEVLREFIIMNNS